MMWTICSYTLLTFKQAMCCRQKKFSSCNEKEQTETQNMLRTTIKSKSGRDAIKECATCYETDRDNLNTNQGKKHTLEMNPLSPQLTAEVKLNK
jgi:hypothetical protein